MDWVYFAAKSQAGQTPTIEFAMINNVIYRTSHNTKGALISNVRSLRPDDRILLVYRQGRSHVVRVCARIAAPQNPAPGTDVIQRISGPLAAELFEAGYPPVENGIAEVIQLEDVQQCEFQLVGRYNPRTAIQKLKQEDADFIQRGTEPASPKSREDLDHDSREPVNQNARPTEGEPVSILPPSTVENVSQISARSGVRPFFDAYVMVDWSAKGTPATGADSVWMGYGVWQDGILAESQANPRTRTACMEQLRTSLTDYRRQNKKVLMAFDFAFGYPSGFAAALRLDQPCWKALWGYFRESVTDDADNRHNRDEFAARCNQLISSGNPGPFWGCPSKGVVPGVLTTNRVGLFRFPYRGMEEYRLTEKQTRRKNAIPQSVWKLNQGVSVGGQTILGIKHLADLRCDPQLTADIRVWPFETGWALPSEATLVLAEIFPSVLRVEEGLDVTIPDCAQVRTCLRHAARLDRDGTLGNAFHRPSDLTDVEAGLCTTEEGWILFA